MVRFKQFCFYLLKIYLFNWEITGRSESTVLVSQALCLPVSVHELVENIAKESTSIDAVRYAFLFKYYNIILNWNLFFFKYYFQVLFGGLSTSRTLQCGTLTNCISFRL